MFCPKCGTKAIEGTKFCRSCGSDLDVVSAALTGKLIPANQKDLQKSKKEEDDSNDPDKLWSSFIRNSFVGVAFIIVALYLTLTNTIGGSVWGFWLLIPGMGSLGGGVASYLKARRIERTRAEFNSFAARANAAPLFPVQSNSALPPKSAGLADLYAPPTRNTDDLNAPPTSVTEGTTRHLQMDMESETIALPKSD